MKLFNARKQEAPRPEVPPGSRHVRDGSKMAGNTPPSSGGSADDICNNSPANLDEGMSSSNKDNFDMGEEDRAQQNQ